MMAPWYDLAGALAMTDAVLAAAVTLVFAAKAPLHDVVNGALTDAEVIGLGSRGFALRILPGVVLSMLAAWAIAALIWFWR